MHSLTLILLSLCISTAFSKDPWWKDTVIYEIYPQSFYDSDNDGMGDLKGVEEKAEYLGNLGIGAVWLNPFYKSPLKDNGYDISDYRAINPIFGTMDDFLSMQKTLQKYNIELILDFVPNHTSDQHEWFTKSVKRVDPYTDYYVWRDPKGLDPNTLKPLPPNNWESIFAPGIPGSAWKWNDERKQFYYHAFLVEQPDLNFRNPTVLLEMQNILQFWMDKGVKGFRVDAVPHLVEDENFLDNPFLWIHSRTENLPETYEVIKALRAFLDSYAEQKGIDVFLTTEGYTTQENTLKYYGDKARPGAHFPFNFLLLTDFNSETNAYSLNNTIAGYLARLSDDHWPNWVSGNHDWPRIPSRLGSISATDVMNTINLLLPGTATTFMGDELGMDCFWNMDKSEVPLDLANDYRTPGRIPFQWSDGRNAGFTRSEKPWLPPHPDFYLYNVGVEVDNRETTNLKVFRALVKIRRTMQFLNRQVQTYVISPNVFAFTRELCYGAHLLVILNVGKNFEGPLHIFDKIPSFKHSQIVEVLVRSVNMGDSCLNRKACQSELEEDTFYLPPMSSVVMKF